MEVDLTVSPHGATDDLRGAELELSEPAHRAEEHWQREDEHLDRWHCHHSPRKNTEDGKGKKAG